MVSARRTRLEQKDQAASRLRARFRAAGVYVVSVVSSPGSGKTTLLCRVLSLLQPTHRVAALVGDLATDRDAARLSQSGAAVRQITTGTTGHLDAAMVERSLDGWPLDDIDVLLIEHIGDLARSVSYDLGEDLRVILVAATEGEEKPLKHPAIFHHADVAVVTKMDLADAAEFDLDALRRSIESVRPGMPVLPLSAKTGLGVSAFLTLIESGHQDRASEASI